MSVLLELSVGDLVIDLHTELAPKLCNNFLKLCRSKYYNFSPISIVQQNFSFQTGDPMAFHPDSIGGTSFDGLRTMDFSKRLFKAEFSPKLKHQLKGTVSMACVRAPGASIDDEDWWVGSQFLVTLGDDLDYLDGRAAIFGQVVEGFDTLETINAAFCDKDGRPMKDIRIKHTHVLEDPFPDPEGWTEREESPVPSQDQLSTVRIGAEEEVEESGDEEDQERKRREREARAQALTLEMVGDLPFADVKPPENVLFVCKLNPVTQDEDLHLIFSRFGEILSCEVIRDKRTGDSLQYAFIEFSNQADCEQAYFKMQGVLIDDHRIHVDFSQSVSRLAQNFLNKPRKQMANFGGKEGLVKGRAYQETKSKHEMVFDDEDFKDRKRRRSRTRSRSRSRSRDRSHKDRDGRGHNRGDRYDSGQDRGKDRRSYERRERDSGRDGGRDRDREREREREHDRRRHQDKDRNHDRYRDRERSRR